MRLETWTVLWNVRERAKIPVDAAVHYACNRSMDEGAVVSEVESLKN